MIHMGNIKGVAWKHFQKFNFMTKQNSQTHENKATHTNIPSIWFVCIRSNYN